jgi:uncharacterized membrane protein (DUF485 family)
MQSKYDYAAIAKSPKFQNLVMAKKKFIIPMTVFFLAFYIALPILTSYTKILNTRAIGDITWAWIFAFAQFIMTWTLSILYTKKAASFDKLAEEIRNEARGSSQ